MLADWGSPSSLRVSNCDAHLQEGPGEGSGKLQACQPDLSAREGHGAGHLEGHQMAYTGHPGDRAQPACVHERAGLA